MNWEAIGAIGEIIGGTVNRVSHLPRSTDPSKLEPSPCCCTTGRPRDIQELGSNLTECPMGTAENKQVVQSFYDAGNRGDMEYLLCPTGR